MTLAHRLPTLALRRRRAPGATLLMGLACGGAAAQATAPAPPVAPASAASATTPSAAPVPASAASPAGSDAAPVPPRPTPAARPDAAAAPRAPAAGAARGGVQQVEIRGQRLADADADERRRATASKIVIGRDELDRMGDTSIGEVLKRLPGVTAGGPPGRGGAVRMRGMGGGYTQILVDGERMPPGFQLESLPPEQIERIEVMRAPTAEFGARAIAGTINVVMRADYRRKANEWRLGVGADGGRPQLGGGLTRNGQTDLFGYSVTLNAMRGSQRNDAASTVDAFDVDGRAYHRETTTQGLGWRTGVFATARLQFKLGERQSLDVQPFFNASRTDGGSATRTTVSNEAAPAFVDADGTNRSAWRTGRINAQWRSTTADGTRVQASLGGMLSSSEGRSRRVETGGTAARLPGAARVRTDDSTAREASLDSKGKVSQLVAERHSVALGWELQHLQRDDTRHVEVGGVPEAIGLAFGDDLHARVQRVALYAQDEWDASKALSLSLGARWEGIRTTGAGASEAVSNTSRVFTPLAHLVWKFDDANPRDLLRASLTRSYRSPSTNQLIARPTTSQRYPDLSATNDALSPDRAGNAALRPELAWGLELGVERYLDAGGVLSANVFVRRIDDLIRNVVALETPAWASAPRHVARPRNIGQADSVGLELEAKFRLSDLLPTDLPIGLRTNATWMASRVSGVAGPRNRLEGQPDLTWNVGADWPVKGTPLTVGGNVSATPSYDVRQIDGIWTMTGRRRVVDAYARWRLDADTALTLNASNVAPIDAYGATTALDEATGRTARSETWTRTTTNVQLRLDWKF